MFQRDLYHYNCPCLNQFIVENSIEGQVGIAVNLKKSKNVSNNSAVTKTFLSITYRIL